MSWLFFSQTSHLEFVKNHYNVIFLTHYPVNNESHKNLKGLWPKNKYLFSRKYINPDSNIEFASFFRSEIKIGSIMGDFVEKKATFDERDWRTYFITNVTALFTSINAFLLWKTKCWSSIFFSQNKLSWPRSLIKEAKIRYSVYTYILDSS